MIDRAGLSPKTVVLKDGFKLTLTSELGLEKGKESVDKVTRVRRAMSRRAGGCPVGSMKELVIAYYLHLYYTFRRLTSCKAKFVG